MGDIPFDQRVNAPVRVDAEANDLIPEPVLNEYDQVVHYAPQSRLTVAQPDGRCLQECRDRSFRTRLAGCRSLDSSSPLNRGPRWRDRRLRDDWAG